MVRTGALRVGLVAAGLLLGASPASAQARAVRPEVVAELLGTARVLTDRCRITGDRVALAAVVRRAGYELTDFVPGARFWPLTRRSIDGRFALIAAQGIGTACSVMSEAVQTAVPGY